MPDGVMTHRIKPYSVPGHTGYNTIEITYNFTPGIHVSACISSYMYYYPSLTHSVWEGYCSRSLSLC